jgi:hypothetical protein
VHLTPKAVAFLKYSVFAQALAFLGFLSEFLAQVTGSVSSADDLS